MKLAESKPLIIVGVDEVGRGPLAGPVVAAAVALDSRRPVAGLRDSKKLTPKRRLQLSREIRRNSMAFALGFATVEEIDSLNILHASFLAMERAVQRLRVSPDLVQVDGDRAPRFERLSARVETVVGGDDSVPAISAASIIAKVCRDRLLLRLDRSFPAYGFARNKGYPTKEHLDALRTHGACAIHRRSFGPVGKALLGRS